MREGEILQMICSKFEYRVVFCKSPQIFYALLRNVVYLCSALPDSLRTDNFLYIVYLSREIDKFSFHNDSLRNAAGGLKPAVVLLYNIRFSNTLQLFSLAHTPISKPFTICMRYHIIGINPAYISRHPQYHCGAKSSLN